MKNCKLSIALSLGMLISCSKPTEEEEATRLFEVFEYKTSIPLSSVKIDLLRCSYYDLVFGCQGTQIVSTGLTDTTGRFAFTESVYKKATQGTKLSKLNYWDSDGHAGLNYLAPEGWISIHLIRQHAYPFSRLFFGYFIEGESGHTRINPFTVPPDTIIKIRAFGNETNKVNWQIGNGSMPSYIDFNIFNVNPILADGVLTQSPGKFGTTSVTLSY